MSYVYLPSKIGEPATVGFYDLQGKWYPESDHNTDGEAANRVHFLNGGNDLISLQARVKVLESEISRTANIASCLANGIQPD